MPAILSQKPSFVLQTGGQKAVDTGSRKDLVVMDAALKLGHEVHEDCLNIHAVKVVVKGDESFVCAADGPQWMT